MEIIYKEYKKGLPYTGFTDRKSLRPLSLRRFSAGILVESPEAFLFKCFLVH